ncbi:MAG: urease accessory protein UreH domain-containing protein [Gammaproteobacteria bacterium]
MSSTAQSPLKKLLIVCLALTGIGCILWLDSWFMDHAEMPKLTGDMNAGLLLLIGFLSSFHCVGMCGPLILGYAAKHAKAGQASHIAHVWYVLGKTASYAGIGGLFGLFGAIVAFTPYTQGMVGMLAGCFLLLFGLHMLEVFPALDHFQFGTPKFVMRFVSYEYRKHSHPFAIGLLNGLMILCGPLQAMYVMAAGTGNAYQGAMILFFFGLGTAPMLLGFGFLTTLLSGSLTPKLLKASGVVVMALGVIMLNRGLAVTGTGIDFNTMVARLSQHFSPAAAESAACDVEQVINMDVVQAGYVPNQFTLRKGVPVKWVINGKEINQCNKAIVVSKYGLEIEVKPGPQVIEFTPDETGVIAWSCWMGMIPGSFIVVEDVQENDLEEKKVSQVVAFLEDDYQRLLAQFKDKWHRILSFVRE